MTAVQVPAWRRAWPFVIALLVLVPLVAPTPAAAAVTYTVTRLDDPVPAACDSDCSLREAVLAANANPGADIIDLSVAGTYTLMQAGAGEDAAATGDLDVTDTVAINGVAAGDDPSLRTITAGTLDRVFDVIGGDDLALTGLSVTGGSAVEGGGVSAPDAGTVLTMTNVVIVGNATTDGSGGGVLAIDATVTLTDVEVSDNDAVGIDQVGGGLFVQGGSLDIGGESLVTGNSGDFGAGMFLYQTDAQIFDTDVTNNTAGVAGGGIESDEGTLELRNSTVSGNTAPRDTDSGDFVGGGIQSFLSALTLQSVTISGNQATLGGGIYNDDGSSLAMTNVTISGNTAEDQGGGVYNDQTASLSATNVTFGGGNATPPNTVNNNGLDAGNAVTANTGSGPVSFRNTIVADSAGRNCFGSAEITSLGENLEEDQNTCGFTQPSDQTSVAEAGLLPLADYGGRVQTHALSVDSPAVDSVDTGTCPPTDARGVPRPRDGDGDQTAICDAGAFERDVPATGLAVTKDAPETVTVGQQFTYDIVVSNGGAETATAVTVTDPLPDGVSFVSASPPCAHDQGSDTVTCSLGTLPPGASEAVTIVVTAEQAGTSTNTATAESTEDAPVSDDATTTAVEPAPTADLSVTKMGPRTATVGQEISYTITVGNGGPETATAVTVTDVLPEEVTFESMSPAQGCDEDGGTVTCSFDSLAPAATRTITITVTVDQAGTFTNTASVDAAEGDPNAANNADSVTTTATPEPSADISVTKEGLSETSVGATFTYTVTVTNDGPDAAREVTVTDELPAEVSFLGVSPPEDCAGAGGTVVCAFDSLASGDSRTIRISVRATQAGTFTNRATAVAEQEDPNTANNAGSATTTARAAPSPGPSPDPTTSPGPSPNPTASPGPSPTPTPTPTDGVPSDDQAVRVAGDDRIETALAVSQAEFGDDQAGAVVLARADLFPDALAGTPLAMTQNAPLLLTAPDSLNPATEAELVRVLPPAGTVYLLGGEHALSAAVADRISALGFRTVRYGAENRFATAVVIADQGLGNPGTLLAASGNDFPDALAAGAAGGAAEAAVVLTAAEVLPPETRAYLDARPGTTRFAVGGPAALAVPDATPLAGPTRFETVIAVAERFFTDPPVVGVATARRFPDALAGGAQVGRAGGPILLSEADALPPTIRDYLERNRESIDGAFIYGGTEALLPAVLTAVNDAIQD